MAKRTVVLKEKSELTVRQKLAVMAFLPDYYSIMEDSFLHFQIGTEQAGTVTEREQYILCAELVAQLMSIYNSDALKDYDVLIKTVDYLQDVYSNDRLPKVQQWMAEMLLEPLLQSLQMAELIKSVSFV